MPYSPHHLCQTQNLRVVRNKEEKNRFCQEDEYDILTEAAGQ